MKMQLFNFENDIIFNDENINVLEIENQNAFIRIIESLNNIAKGLEPKEKIYFYIDDEEISLSNRITCFFDIFNIDFSNKKYITCIYNHLARLYNENEEINFQIQKLSTQIIDKMKAIFNDFEIELEYNEEFEINDILKSMKIKIKTQESSIFDNLLTLIDLESVININRILVFINLKDYLNNEQIVELYKYSKYKKVNILLIESKSSGLTLEYEKKLIIDFNYDEFVIAHNI